MKRGWMYLLALVAVSSAWPLTQVALDRSTPPRQTLRFSQRELTRAWREDENTGVALSWSWREVPEVDSVGPERLQALGLTCDDHDYSCNYGDGRAGWMVVGIDTVPWRRRVDSLQRTLDSLDRVAPQDSETVRTRRDKAAQFDQVARFESRLVLVDVGADPAPLLARWSDGAHLILPARINAYRQSWPRDSLAPEPAFYRIHAEPLPASLYVPNQWAGAVRDTSWDRRVAYQVVVGVGRGWLPRVLEVTR